MLWDRHKTRINYLWFGKIWC